MNYKKSYCMLIIGIWSGAGISFAGLYLGVKSDTIIIGNFIAFIGLMLILGGIGQALIFYKCPDCGKRLNIRGQHPNFCPECGCKLDL